MPLGLRGWETIPGVIRDDGVETFRLEVDVGGPVESVRFADPATFPSALVVPVGWDYRLRDDGLGVDRAAGDFVFTAGPFRYDTAVPMPEHWGLDPASPAGIYATWMGSIVITELDASESQFLLPPEIGLLRSDIPATALRATASADVVVSTHVINVRTQSRQTQQQLRAVFSVDFTHQVYAALPDAFDFLILLSTYKVERLPRFHPQNFNAGMHLHAKTDYAGTGLGYPYDGSSYYGSAGRLLSVNVLDAYERGLYSGNAAHELTHQWASYTSTDISDGTGHYNPRSDVASLVGGFQWTDLGNGTYARDCTFGRNGAYHAPPMDRYMMGLALAQATPGVRISALPLSGCLDTVTGWTTVPVATIQAAHGQRVPGPDAAQRSFKIGFVAESNGRLLNATEMTFYEMFATAFVQPIPSGDPDPFVGFGWTPITHYFGADVTWTTVVPAPTTGVEAGTGSLTASFRLTARPNPSSGMVALQSGRQSANEREPRMAIYDLRGHLVRSGLRAVATGDGPGGAWSWVWDGVDDYGAPVPAGVYTWRVWARGAMQSGKLLRVR